MIKQIKIGGIVYDINMVEWPIDSNGNLQFGMIYKDTANIVINNNLDKQVQEQTLVHEMMHAIVFEAGLELEQEEEIVNRISLVLYQVLKDNKFNF